MRTLYHDAHLLLVDKPSGLLSQPGRTLQDSVHHRLQQRFHGIELLHRLDQPTSGIMVFALSVAARKSLARQFQERQVSKAYQAIVYGTLPEQGQVDWPMRCDWPNRPRQEIHAEGKAALTHWQVLETLTLNGQRCSRVRLTPVTGRSHQLRVHMAHMGTPIIGDNLYAHEAALAAAPRLNLHAEILRFNHPINQQRMQFYCAPSF